MVHEYMHHIEYQIPEVKRRTAQLLNKRTQGEEWTEIYRGSGEYGKADKFPDHYMGKWYGPRTSRRFGGGRAGMPARDAFDDAYATEGVTMAVQYLFEDPRKLASEHPDIFELAVWILRGDQ